MRLNDEPNKKDQSPGMAGYSDLFSLSSGTGQVRLGSCSAKLDLSLIHI